MQDQLLMPVDIAVAGKFHAFKLASALANLNRLRGLYSVHRNFSPPPRVPRSRYHNRLDFAVWAYSSRFLPTGYSHQRKERAFDAWLLGRLQAELPGVLHSWNGSSNVTFSKLKGTGWRLCLERSCPHNQVQFDLLNQESKILGVPHVQDMDALERNIEELYLADTIIAPSHYSARSYSDPTLAAKVRVNALGSNVPYRERSSKRGPHLKVLMVGNAFLRKGTHYLVEAFKLIRDPAAQLWIRGDVPEEYRRRIRDPRVRIISHVSVDQLAELYRNADVFVQPSIDEGFGMTVLEALAFGLPVVVTENVGANDILSPDTSITVPIRDARAIADAVFMARELPGEGFDLSRKSILGANTWERCAERMISEIYDKA